jgi:hypothetical protein
MQNMDNIDNANANVDDICATSTTTNTKRCVGRPKKDRSICAKCGLQKELVGHRVSCRECWNNYYKNYYNSKTEYANKKRDYQRKYSRDKSSTVIDGGIGEQAL